MTVGDGLVGIIGAVVLGALLAVAVAVALSPLAPLGPVRPVYPDPGVAFDWTVLGLGLLVLVVILGAVAVVLALQRAPHRAARRGAAGCAAPLAAWPAPPRRPACPSRRSPASVSPSSPDGERRRAGALGHPRRDAGHRGRGRHRHVRRQPQLPRVAPPSLRMELELRADRAAAGRGTSPPRSGHLLDHDPSVAAWSGYWFGNLQVDGPHRAGARRVTGGGRGAPDADRPRLRRARTDRARCRHAGPAPQGGRRHRDGPLRDDAPRARCGSSARPPCPPSGSAG